MAAHVTFVANEGYAKGLAVTLKSLLDSLRSASAFGTTGESTTCLRSMGLCGSVVSREPVSAVDVWLIDTGLLDESWRTLEGMVHLHNESLSGMAEQQAPQLADSSAGVCCSAHPPDHELHQSQARLPAVQLHRIPTGAAVVLSEPPAGPPANLSTSKEGKATDSSLCAHTEKLHNTAAAGYRASSCSSCSTKHPAVTYHLPPCESYASQFCWLKLLLPWLLPAEVYFVLYLDCDMLVMNSPCGLLQEASTAFDASPNTLLAAVRDFGLPCGHAALLQLPTALERHPESTLSSSTISSWSSTSPYFNAGLLLYNLKAWRQQGPRLHSALLQFGFRAEQRVSGSTAEAAAQPSSNADNAATGGSRPCPPHDVGGLLCYSDQDALNLLCCDRGGWVELDFCWNVQGIGTYLSDRVQDSGPQQPALFTAASAARLEASPAIIHFTGPPTITPSQLLNPYVRPPSKPWAFACLNPWKDLWHGDLDTTPWAGWRPEQLMFEHAAVQELVGLCRQLLEAEGRAAAAAAAAAQHDAIFGGLHASCTDQGSTQHPARAQSTDGFDGHASGVERDPLPGVEGAATQGVGCSSRTGAEDSCIASPRPHTGGSLSPAVCATRGFDVQSFLRRVAALCLTAADSDGVRHRRLLPLPYSLVNRRTP